MIEFSNVTAWISDYILKKDRFPFQSEFQLLPTEDRLEILKELKHSRPDVWYYDSSSLELIFVVAETFAHANMNNEWLHELEGWKQRNIIDTGIYRDMQNYYREAHEMRFSGSRMWYKSYQDVLERYKESTPNIAPLIAYCNLKIKSGAKFK